MEESEELQELRVAANIKALAKSAQGTMREKRDMRLGK
jgi:hypothetical protein|tara:strand:- start:747 stop:860 length:114 start_codon:yes stop_codon:yes gene_type:complete